MPKSPEQPSDDKVKVKITKFGYMEVSSGVHIPGKGDVMLDAGEILEVDLPTAEALEARGFAEIQ